MIKLLRLVQILHYIDDNKYKSFNIIPYNLENIKLKLQISYKIKIKKKKYIYDLYQCFHNIML